MVLNESSVAPVAFWLRPLPIVAVALLLRLAWAACVPVDPVSDGVLYDAFARSILEGHGYAFADGTLTEYWPVGTSATYALLYLAFGIHAWVVPLFQALVGAYIVLLTWRITLLTIGGIAAGLAAWLTAFWPLLIEFTTIFASELLFVALVLTSLNFWISRRIPFGVRMILWGATLTAATYVRPTALPIAFVFIGLQWIIDRDWRALIKGTLIVGLTASILFAPWTYRSLALFDRFVVVSANGGVNLWMGNNPESVGGYMALPDRSFANEVDRDHYYGAEALKFIVSHPDKYALLSMKRTVTTFDRETIGIVWNQKGLASRFQDTTIAIMKLVSSAYWWVILIMGFAGAFLALLRHRLLQCWPALAFLGYFAAVPILTVGMDRYHVPIDPILAIFAAYLLCSVISRPHQYFARV